MKKISLIGVLSLLLGCASCGAAKSKDAAYGEMPGVRQEYGGQAYPEAAPPSPGFGNEKAAEEYAYDDTVQSDEAPKKFQMTQPSSPPAPPAQEGVVVNGGEHAPIVDGKTPDVQPQDDPMIVYSGYLQLRVKRLLDAVDQITTLVEKRGGYIDSLTASAVVVRIPGKDFEEAMKALSAVGDLLDRWVRAQDVTEQFTDLKGRLTVAEEARERLLKLLAKVENVSERLRILQEIKRLSEMIDTIDSSLAAIRNLVDYFTITLDLVPVLAVERVDTGLSPFEWIRSLKPHVQSLYEGKDAITVKLPRGFVLFDDEDHFRAQAADTSVIRAATVVNEPLGDNRFWADAVDFEMTTRQEKIIESAQAGKLTYRVYENDDVTPRFYLVAILAGPEKITVIEVFYPNKEAYRRHHAGVVEALETVEVK